MQIETLKDVLHWTREFHQHLSQCASPLRITLVEHLRIAA